MRVLSTLAAIAVTAMVVPAVAQETLKIGGIALFANQKQIWLIFTEYMPYMKVHLLYIPNPHFW